MRFKFVQSHKTDGYTLIEVMVAVAIIVLLLSVSFVSFQSARERSDDNFIKEQLGVMRIVAEQSYRQNRSTSVACTDIATTSNNYVATLPSSANFVCLDGPRGYAFDATLSDGTHYCVDNVGRTHESATRNIADTGNCSGGTDCDCRP